MAAIEPNWISLLWFAAFATICMVAFLVVAGMFPLRSRPERRDRARRRCWWSATAFCWQRFWWAPGFTVTPNSGGAP